MGENGEDFDFGTAAMRMLEGIRRNEEDDPRNRPIEELEEPDSPTPGTKGLVGSRVLTDEPRSGEFGRSAEIRRSSDVGKVERRSISSTRELVPREDMKEEESEEMEYVDVDDLKEEI
jgi:hypothetical protein